MTKYVTIANDIERKVLSKKYQYQLPSEHELAEIYNTSKVVISRALKVLAAKDILHVVQGSGIYVKKKNAQFPDLVETPAAEHDGFYHSMKGKATITSHVVSFDIRKPDEDECEKLKIGASDDIYDIIRQRLINGKAGKLEYTVMPVKVIPGITDEVLHKSIYHYIRKDLHLEIGKANRVIVADKADAYDKDYLDCQDGDAILAVHQLAYLKDGRPFEVSETRDRYDRAGYILFEVNNS